jgi:hypothetical protein
MMDAATFRFARLAGLLAAFWTTQSVSAGEGDSRRFQVQIESRLKMKVPTDPEPKPLDAETEIVYDLTRKDKSIDLAIHSVSVIAKVQGVTRLAMTMDGGRYKSTEAGKESSFKPSDAPERIKTALAEFDQTAALIEVDAEGGEVARSPRIPTSSLLFESGMIENSRLFHPRFPKDKDRWSAPAVISMGKGQSARGTLTYRKLGLVESGKSLRVEVKGELSADGKSGEATVKNSKYTVAGEQVFDLTDREWVSGDWKIDLTFESEFKNEPVGSATGSMVVAFKRLPVAPR